MTFQAPLPPAAPALPRQVGRYRLRDRLALRAPVERWAPPADAGAAVAVLPAPLPGRRGRPRPDRRLPGPARAPRRARPPVRGQRPRAARRPGDRRPGRPVLLRHRLARPGAGPRAVRPGLPRPGRPAPVPGPVPG